MMKAATTVDPRKGEQVMSYNVGSADRAVRIVVGLALLVLGFLHIVTGPWAIAAYIVGAVALITGLFRFCPAWSLCGINTSPTKPIEQK